MSLSCLLYSIRFNDSFDVYLVVLPLPDSCSVFHIHDHHLVVSHGFL